MPKIIDDTRTLRIEKIVQGGMGLAKDDGKTFFIYGALPDEKIVARIYTKRKGVYFGETIDIIEPSPIRIEPKCEHFGKCGGCTFQHIPYEKQLEFKRAIVEETLHRIGKFDDVEIEDIVPSPMQWSYRNKMEFAFGKNNDGVFVGLHRRGRFDQLLPVAKDCLLISDEMRNVVASIEEMARSEIPYDPKSGTGYLRFLTIRKSFAMNKLLVGITVTRNIEPKMFKKWFEELDMQFPKLIAGGFITINLAGSSSCGEIIPLFGENEFIEKIGEKKFSVSADSFFQTNPLGAEKLYSVVKNFAEPRGNEKLWDLYCGTGTIGIYLRDSVASVLGIESNEKSIDDARKNAELNEMELETKRNEIVLPSDGKVHFISGDVKKILWEFQQRNFEPPDIITIDPPRAGLSKKVVARIAHFAPKRIVYVSCNPVTLARDGALFGENGFKLVRVRPVDMFPQTYHIESVALFEKYRPT